MGLGRRCLYKRFQVKVIITAFRPFYCPSSMILHKDGTAPFPRDLFSFTSVRFSQRQTITGSFYVRCQKACSRNVPTCVVPFCILDTPASSLIWELGPKITLYLILASRRHSLATVCNEAVFRRPPHFRCDAYLPTKGTPECSREILVLVGERRFQCKIEERQ